MSLPGRSDFSPNSLTARDIGERESDDKHRVPSATMLLFLEMGEAVVVVAVVVKAVLVYMVGFVQVLQYCID